MLKAFFNFITGNSESSEPESMISSGGERTIRDLEGFVNYVASALVDFPEDVKVTSEEKEDGYTIRIDCRKEDIGKIVGRRGKTIMAIRSLVSGAAGRMRQRVSVEVID